MSTIYFHPFPLNISSACIQLYSCMPPFVGLVANTFVTLELWNLHCEYLNQAMDRPEFVYEVNTIFDHLLTFGTFQIKSSTH